MNNYWILNTAPEELEQVFSTSAITAAEAAEPGFRRLFRRSLALLWVSSWRRFPAGAVVIPAPSLWPSSLHHLATSMQYKVFKGNSPRQITHSCERKGGFP
jgi:hypothetical protein